MNIPVTQPKYIYKKANALKKGDRVRAIINGQISFLEVVNVIKASGMSEFLIIQYAQFFPYPIELNKETELTLMI